MSNRILFYAYTPFQIISSIAIKINHFPNDFAEIVLDDSIQMREVIKENACQNEVFRAVYFCDSSKFFNRDNNRITREINRMKATVNPFYFRDSISEINGVAYDVFITSEMNYITESIYSILRKSNREIKVCLMDESYGSYTYCYREHLKPKSVKNKIKYFVFYGIGKIIRRKFIPFQAKKLFLFAPELNCWKECPYKLERIIIRKTGLIQIINELFGYSPSLSLEYDRKYIYFEDSYYWTYKNNKDIRVIEYIANNVGSNNMMIKLHPRNKVNRFIERGYKTNSEYGVPWELISINMDESEKRVFITYSSSAVLNYRLLVDKSFVTILLYKCFEKEFFIVDELAKKWFEKFAKLYPESVIIPADKDEFIECLNRIRG